MARHLLCESETVSFWILWKCPDLPTWLTNATSRYSRRSANKERENRRDFWLLASFLTKAYCIFSGSSLCVFKEARLVYGQWALFSFAVATFTCDDVKYYQTQLSFQVRGKDYDVSAWNRKMEQFLGGHS